MLIYFQIGWQVILLNLSAKRLDSVLNVLKEATFEVKQFL